MKRRDFLRVASGAAGGVASVGAAGAATDSGDPAQQATPTTTGGNETTGAGSGTTTGTATNGTATNTTAGGGGGLPGAGTTETVTVGPGANNVFDPAELSILPGTTVEFVWESDNHNVVVENQPEGANWEGTAGSATDTYNTGHTYTHTFETLGTYDYYCNPHRSLGMTGVIDVVEQLPQQGGGATEIDPEHMGVPFQAQWVGAATLLMMVVSVVYSFFALKYGESRHASSPEE